MSNAESTVSDVVIRNYRPGDEHSSLALIDAAPDFPYYWFNRSASLDALRTVPEHPDMHPSHNLFFAEAAGQVVGYAELWRSPERTRGVGRVLVHPQWRRRRLGTELLQRISQRARVSGANRLDVGVAAQSEGAQRFLEARGFRAVHYSWHMQLPDVTAAPAPRSPVGYQRRSFVPSQDEPTSAQIENASFQDEWEFMPVPVGEIEGFVRSPSFRADGVIYALHQGQVMGECWTWIDRDSMEQTGGPRGDAWCLCVHPEHRGRGLGRALLLSSVHWLRRQGMTCAGLCVDGANERARRLYESVGFRTQQTDIWYREEL